jgi:hypothetical protein
VAASDGSRAFRYVVPPRAVATFVWNGPGG